MRTADSDELSRLVIARVFRLCLILGDCNVHCWDRCPWTFWQVLDQLKTVPLIPDAAGLYRIDTSRAHRALYTESSNTPNIRIVSHVEDHSVFSKEFIRSLGADAMIFAQA